MEGKLGGIVVALLIAAGAVWYGYSKKGNTEQEVRDTAMAMLAMLPDYEAKASAYDRYFEAEHQAAFDRHFRMGSRRRAASFDEDAYWADLFAAMAASAEADRETELAENLRTMSGRLRTP